MLVEHLDPATHALCSARPSHREQFRPGGSGAPGASCLPNVFAALLGDTSGWVHRWALYPEVRAALLQVFQAADAGRCRTPTLWANTLDRADPKYY